MRGEVLEVEPSMFLLTNSDWDLINTGSTNRSFTQGESIITQGENNINLYFLVKGVVIGRCTKNNRKISLPLINSEGIVFGEMGLFSSLPSYSSYIAQSDTVVCKELQSSFLFPLFEAHPQLGVKMYNFVGQRLSLLVIHTDKFGSARRLTNSSLNPTSKSPTLFADQKQAASQQEIEFLKLFPGIPESEKLIVCM